MVSWSYLLAVCVPLQPLVQKLHSRKGRRARNSKIAPGSALSLARSPSPTVLIPGPVPLQSHQDLILVHRIKKQQHGHPSGDSIR
ncbi:uncharacterized protein STEHIDRAFT_144344 [Stereum hirsutum FP-91666 SS1]|uniref:uncharacterized protein n=1 Tax=Stereum hirsutum (strain FP-91666) TaxID=721885 RepID=UPI000440D5BE|nr:uncharacterized protein STEHIDRAFT_144344 [Stereum hirsutum FP-91666 SS1]EIM90803.1 hypothetical protein STEHIDRAFT_144344 [Stereum hirsutum FP-91666 SS1]